MARKSQVDERFGHGAGPEAPARKRAAAKAAAAEEGAVAPQGAPKMPRPRRPTASGPSLVIVESPKKAKSINKFLGSGYVVKASMGHVRDLPKRKLGLDVEPRLRPVLRDHAGQEGHDQRAEARGGQGRAWSTWRPTPTARARRSPGTSSRRSELPDERVRRVTFHEITERAVKEAFRHAGPINMDMVNAQQARRFLDRFVGYQLSPLLWKKVARHLSAGRVQSVAVRLIADREQEIQAFVSEEYWKITATVSPAGSTGRVRPVRGRPGRVRRGQVRGQERGRRPRRPRRPGRRPPTSSASVEEIEKLDKADPPFKTSTLQQQAAIRLRFSGKRTMKVAQELYEGIDVDGSGPVGLITYMRTDSLRV